MAKLTSYYLLAQNASETLVFPALCGQPLRSTRPLLAGVACGERVAGANIVGYVPSEVNLMWPGLGPKCLGLHRPYNDDSLRAIYKARGNVEKILKLLCHADGTEGTHP